MCKKVFLTGVTGQSGSYLSEILLKNGYDVNGLMRRGSTFTTERIEHLLDNENFNLHYGDLSDGLNLYHLIEKIQPDYIINAGAMSHVFVSFQIPIYCMDVTGTAVVRLLEAIKQINTKIKFIQFSSSEMFGNCGDTILTETSPMQPCSPYAIAKYMGYLTTKHYRDAYGIWASNAIFFNMESQRRGHTFVTKKICDYIIKIKNHPDIIKTIQPLQLGNLDAMRDWGSCEEYMDGVYRMMQMKNCDDILFATGETHSVKEFCTEAFKEIGITIFWGKDPNDKILGLDNDTGKTLIETNDRLKRPLELNFLCGNPKKAEEKLGWIPKTKFKDLIKLMIKE
ncbi:MAG: GDP-mannose 4,6-dehydratase [Candidatus Nanoarchaeia archaeon]|nr:GDP-mannose 4,6-dehydratase [Candidatus Nanoarchaeia archaeon]